MISLLRSFLFQAAYWLTSIFFALGAIPLLLIPNRKPLMFWTLGYTRTMCLWMRVIAGIRIRVAGKEKLPDGPCIIAAKHQSWGDGFLMFSQFFDLAFVTGDHLENFPLVGGILKKMGAIVVDNCGGAYARARLVDNDLERARTQNRRILIYPEGHLAPVGRQYRYKKGVYHMYEAYGCAVAPVATNLGLRWPQQSWRLRPGEAVIEFLDPIEPGLNKETFMARLETAVEARSIALLGEETPEGVEIGALLPDPRSQAS
ncbi:lysophospholipid acyltransferase family protein [Hyphococcus luteus]|uniref:1-acyl-sn-glycerol-3-phosphate acyltransferase n=1 Tax=Hyphococcus luteus TaxID=2058213 RepID=A0A2S7K474_9PROT|nr:1-acyl-sn-glycerol-3-phosphate acyltransferase [Marinicaulis flavus]PQA87314.1 1-acyl-sn-glycerol-3-phosphate acyltransferase [Marinicaulis flavus]